jgi:uncharacterized protein
MSMGGSSHSFLPLLIPFSLSAAVAIVLGLFFGKYFEGIGSEALGLSARARAGSDLLLGGLVGAVGITSAVLIAWTAGSVTIEPNLSATGVQITATLFYTFVIFLIGALSEEALFRGYLLQTLIRDKHVAVGIIFTSLLFALAHNQNPNTSKLSLFNTFAAGVWFAIAYLKTQNLWFPLGIHLIWNWLQGPVFGISVSGISDLNPHPWLRTTDLGPEWLTGGAYGIEGGLACTGAILSSILIIHFVPDWRRTALHRASSRV